MDCAHGDPIGADMHVSTAGFAHMTAQLKHFVDQTHGHLVMALEGGYGIEAIAEATRACIQVLLGDEPLPVLPDQDWFLGEDGEEKEIQQVAENRLVFSRELENFVVVQRRHWSCL